MMFLVDTNIFLEILLGQSRKEDCKRFLKQNAENLNITDFSLHSIGVILFKFGKEHIFMKLVQDISGNVNLLSLPMQLYEEVANAGKSLKLDFDDAYQYTVAKCYGLKVVTMDRDFERVRDVEVLFL